MPALARNHLPIRLAAINGRKVKGVRKPSPDISGSRPLPPGVIHQAESVAAHLAHTEAALTALFNADITNPVIVRALVRDALINLTAGRNQAQWLAMRLADPASLWR
jgi:hypothetical protein